MSKDSKIQWTDHTWNIARGCTKVDEDCKYCYMYRDANRYGYDAKTVERTKTVFRFPLTVKEPSRIFTSSLTDVFHPAIDSFRDEMWEIIRKCPQHTFQILTKRPERIAEHLPADWGDGWDNVWLGTSVGSSKSLHRIVTLSQIRAKVKFLSLEPLHERIDLNDAVIYRRYPRWPHQELWFKVLPAFHWVIVGGESGNESGKYRYRPCEFEWIEKIVNDCKEAGVPVFVKQMGAYLAKRHGLGDRHGTLMEHWPPSLQVREFPKGKEVENEV
jgi:protein gp37